MRAFLAGLLVCVCVSSASAQTLEKRRRRKGGDEPPPLALALNLAFSATFWNEVQVSTMGAVSDLGDLIGAGYYKLEIIQLVLMSREGRRPLKETVEKRRKGARLEALAAEYRLEYDKLYESALAVEEIVDRQYLPRLPEKRRRRERDDW